MELSPLHNGLFAESGIGEGSFVGDVLIPNGDPTEFVLLGLFWFLFPRWFFYSMPVSYGGHAFNPLTKRNLRKAAFPTVFFVFVLDSVTAAYEFHFESEVPAGVGLVEVVAANAQSVFSPIVYVLGLVMAMVAAARASGLSDAIVEHVGTEDATEQTVRQRALESKKVLAWQLVPYTDGRFAYYPGTRWNKGYVLTSDQAAEFLGLIERRGLSYVQYFLIVGLAVGIGQFFGSSSDEFGIRDYLTSGWFWAAFAVVIVVLQIAETFRRTKKLTNWFGELPTTEHPFPSGYFRLKKLSFRFLSIWVLALLALLTSVFAALLLFVTVHEGIENLGAGIFIPAFLLLLFGAGMYVWLLFWHLKFRRLNGRRPRLTDLKPIDPETGRMSPNPFKLAL